MSDFTSSLGKPLGIALGVLIVGGVAWWFFGDKLKAAANKINPASDENFIYKDVIGGIGGAVTGQKDFSFGSWIYDLFNEDANLASDRRARELLAAKQNAPADERAWYGNLFGMGG